MEASSPVSLEKTRTVCVRWSSMTDACRQPLLQRFSIITGRGGQATWPRCLLSFPHRASTESATASPCLRAAVSEKPSEPRHLLGLQLNPISAREVVRRGTRRSEETKKHLLWLCSWYTS